MRSFTSQSLIIAATLYLASVSFAQSQENNCHNALIMNTTVKSSDFAKKISILSITNESTFEEKRRDAGASATFPLGDIIVTPEMSYSDFDQKRRDFLGEYRFNLNERETTAFSETYLSDAARIAYSDCLNSRNTVGAHAWVLNASPDDALVAIRISLNTNDPDTTPRSIILSYLGEAEIVIAPEVRAAMQSFTGSRTFDIALRRAKLNETVILNVNVLPSTSGSATIMIPRNPTVQKKEWEYRNDRVSLTVQRSYSDTHKQHPERICIPDSPGDLEWLGSNGEFVEGSAKGTDEPVGEIHGDEIIGASPAISEKQRICYDTNVGTDGSATGHTAKFVISAIARRPRWAALDE